MFVRLKIKLAEVVNGVDLSHCDEGDVIDIAEQQAAMLLAEGWAERVADDEIVSSYLNRAERDIAADGGRRQRRRKD